MSKDSTATNVVGEIKPRPSITSYGAVPTGLNEKINRIEMYRTKRKGWHFWKQKYEIHTLALCDDAIYEIFPPYHKPHPPLFGERKL